jgi:hypothetical protein
MKNENDSNDPTANPQDQPSLQGPAPPAAPLQGALPDNCKRETNEEKNETKELAREFRIAEKWVIGTNIVLAVIGIVALCIYYGQLQVMRGQLGEIIKQYPEIQKSANAAKSAAETADTTLKSTEKSFVVDQRPYIVVAEGYPQFLHPPVVGQQAQVNVLLKNIGKTPAVQVVNSVRFIPYRSELLMKLSPEERKKARQEYISFIQGEFATLRTGNEKTQKEIANLKKLDAGQDVAPNKTYFLTTDQPAVFISETESALLKTGEISLYIVGVTSYIDSYGITYKTEFCSFYFGTDPTVWHICDSHNTIR